jgi:uncharacterized protein YggE
MRLDVGVLRAWTVGLAALAALAVAGCGGGDTKTVTVSSSGSSGGGTSKAPADSGDGGGSVDTSDALAKQTVRALGARDATVEIAILDMKVQDRLMRTTIAFSPKYPNASPDEQISLYDMNGKSPLYVTLVDPVNLKRYIAVKDSSGQSLAADEVSTDTLNGGTATGTYTFAAPPADVAKLDVQVGEWPTFTDVQVQR